MQMATESTDVTGGEQVPILGISRPCDGSIVAFRGVDTAVISDMIRDGARYQEERAARGEPGAGPVAVAAEMLAGWLDGDVPVQSLAGAFEVVRKGRPSRRAVISW